MTTEQQMAGTPLDDLDLLIAATALSHSRMLVTNNGKRVSGVSGLAGENASFVATLVLRESSANYVFTPMVQGESTAGTP